MKKSLEEQIEVLRLMKDYSAEDGPPKPTVAVLNKVVSEVEKMKQYLLKKKELNSEHQLFPLVLKIAQMHNGKQMNIKFY